MYIVRWYRIEAEKSTGLDIRTFDDALTFKIALMVVNYIVFGYFGVLEGVVGGLRC